MTVTFPKLSLITDQREDMTMASSPLRSWKPTTPPSSSGASPCTNPTAPCWATSATRSATISGTGWCATAASSTPAALEIARAFGLSTHPQLTRGDELDASVDFDPYRAPGMVPLIDSWLPLSLALNSLNRAMGQSDLDPFVLSQPAIDKLGFVHDLVHAT
jgi:hypothetical protein